jgi:hypothetical protein
MTQTSASGCSESLADDRVRPEAALQAGCTKLARRRRGTRRGAEIVCPPACIRFNGQRHDKQEGITTCLPGRDRRARYGHAGDEGQAARAWSRRGRGAGVMGRRNLHHSRQIQTRRIQVAASCARQTETVVVVSLWPGERPHVVVRGGLQTARSGHSVSESGIPKADSLRALM